MAIQHCVVDELRLLFKKGATPSRLIQHIVSSHPDEKDHYGLIQEYFREGFGVQIVRGLSPAEHYDDIGLRFAYLNEDLLHEIIQQRAAWDQPAQLADAVSTSWLDTLSAKAASSRIQEAGTAGFSELSESWDHLNQREQSAIIRTIAGFNGRTEMVHILARLVEQLQQQIVHLEAVESHSSCG